MTQTSSIAVSDTAVRIAAEVIGEESIARIGRDLGTIHRDEIVRQGLEAVYRLLVQTETHRVHGEICAAVQPNSFCSGGISTPGAPMAHAVVSMVRKVTANITQP